jgi:hypothetical protein
LSIICSFYLTETNPLTHQEVTATVKLKPEAMKMSLYLPALIIMVMALPLIESKAQPVVCPPSEEVIVYSVTDATCHGNDDGSIVLNLKGAKPFTVRLSYGCGQPETKSSSAQPGTSVYSFTGLIAGDYSIEVQDGNGCIYTRCVKVDEPAALSAGMIFSPVVCIGETTEVIISGKGGTPPYTLLDENKEPIITFNQQYTLLQIEAGKHLWTLADASTCAGIDASIEIKESSLQAEILAITDVSCFGNNTGEIIAGGKEGTGTYWFSLNAQPAQLHNVFTGLTAGNYTITVTDEMGCHATTVASINEAPVLDVQLLATLLSCEEVNDGSINGKISGGKAPYKVFLYYECSLEQQPLEAPLDKSQGMMYWGLRAGNYMVKVTDSNGCESIQCIEVGINRIVLDYSILPACESTLSLVSFINPGLSGIDGITSGWSSGSAEVNTGLSSLSILGGKAKLMAYDNYEQKSPGTIVHRGTRGIGVLGGGTPDEISRAQGLSVEFAQPVHLTGFEVRSLFIEGLPQIPEQGKALLMLGEILVAEYDLVARQFSGSVGQLITIPGEPLLVDRLDLYVPAEYRSYSEFALAKITFADIKPMVDINLNPSYPGVSKFEYLWENNSSASLTNAVPGNYYVMITAIDGFGDAVCSAEFEIPAMAACPNPSVMAKSIEFMSELEETEMYDEPLSSFKDMANLAALKTYPNPFTAEATIEFSVEQNLMVSIEIFNLLGKKVATLYEGLVVAGNTERVPFRSGSLPEGIYTCKLTAGGKAATTRMILTR